MAEHKKEIHINKGVKYSDKADAYTIQLKKRRNYWWLLLLLLPLLLLIKCERSLTVGCYDAGTKDPIEGVEVMLKYESHYVFDDRGLFPKDEYTKETFTDEEGLARFDNIECSVFCFLFHLGSQMEISAVSDCYASVDTTLCLHCHRRVELPMRQRTGLPVCVVDKDTYEGLSNAKVRWRMGDGSGSTIVDNDGYGLLSDVPVCHGTIDRIDASADGYYDTTYYHLSIDDCRDSCLLIKMRPKVENFHVDIVMCIDNTNSMRSLINLVKQNALSFPADLTACCAKKSKKLEDFRLRVISFGDLEEISITKSDFMEIPRESRKFKDFVSGIKMSFGGDNPEDGLEALAMAINSDWQEGSTRCRHIIIVYTDATAHSLGTRKHYVYYPVEPMPADFEELSRWWNRLDGKASRLILFAPDEDYWSIMKDEWPHVYLKPLEDVLSSSSGYDQILEAISNSL